MSVIVFRTVLLAFAVLILTLAAVQDLRSRIVPNGFVISIALAGLLLGALTRPFSLWINIVIALLIVVVCGALAHLDTLGGGDIKLMAATTLLVAPSDIGGLLIAVALAGGVLSVVYLALRLALKRWPPRIRSHHRQNMIVRWWRLERVRIADSRSIPYAVAISGGSISYIIAGWHRCLFATSCSL